MKNHLKQLLAMLAVIPLTFTFAACSGGGTTSSTSEDTSIIASVSDSTDGTSNTPSASDSTEETSSTASSETTATDESNTGSGDSEQTDTEVKEASAAENAQNAITEYVIETQTALEDGSVVKVGDYYFVVTNGTVDKDSALDSYDLSDFNAYEWQESTFDGIATIYTAKINVVVSAIEIVSKLLNRPDPWSFLPDSLAQENLVQSSITTDFSAETSVTSITSGAIGQELAVLYQGLTYAESALSAASMVYTAGEAIAEVYQTFINNNPADYSQFTGSVTIAGSQFSLQITLDGNNYSLLAGNGTVCIELSTDGTTDTGRIQITNGAVLKYQSSQSQLRFAVEFSASILGYTGIFTQDLTFVRTEDAVTGYMYEYLGTTSGTGTELARALYYSDENYTIVTADAKDSGSTLTLHDYTEVYSSATGQFIGAEVDESITAGSITTATYDTYWFSLSDVTGFTSIKVTDEENEDNDLNANTIYVNGSSTPFAVEWNTKLTIKTSRRYDIEMKTVYYVTATVDGDGEVSYDLTETEIPMLFVQADELTDFSADVVANNAGTFSTTPTLTNYSLVSSYHAIMVNTYEALEEVDYTSTVAFIGSKNSFFE